MLAVLLLALAAEPEAEAPPPPAPPRAGLYLGLGGAAVIGAGVACRLLAGAVYDRIDRGYPAFNSYDELRATRATGQLEQSLSFVFIGVGAAIIVAATILTLVLQ